MTCDESTWDAVCNTLNGKLPKPVALQDMGQAEGRGVAWRVAAAIGNAQDVVSEMVNKYEQYAKGRRAKCKAAIDR